MKYFFVSKNFTPQAAAVLAAFDAVNDFEFFPFPATTADAVWIDVVGKYAPKRTILSADDGILANAVELKVLRQSGCSFVYLSAEWADLDWAIYCSDLIRYWPRVLDKVSATTHQSIIELYPKGKVLTTNL